MKKRLSKSLFFIATAITTLTVISTSYSWIKRDWAPSISKDEMKIETSGSLAIQLENSASEYENGIVTDISLNEQIGLGDFKLRQVSNGTGLSQDFFTINYTKGEAREELEHIPFTKGQDTYLNFSSKHGYIELRFFFLSKARDEGGTQLRKYIFIDSFESHINCGLVDGKYDVADAIRVGITIEESNQNFIFKNKVYDNDNQIIPHIGAIGTKDSNDNYIGNGMNIYKYKELFDASKKVIGYTYDLDENDNKQYNEAAIYKNYNVNAFSDFNGGMKEENIDKFTEDDFEKSKTLFSLSYIQQAAIRVRIWLEGYDDNCVDAITGSNIDFKLVFRSFDVDESE